MVLLLHQLSTINFAINISMVCHSACFKLWYEIINQKKVMVLNDFIIVSFEFCCSKLQISMRVQNYAF